MAKCFEICLATYPRFCFGLAHFSLQTEREEMKKVRTDMAEHLKQSRNDLKRPSQKNGQDLSPLGSVPDDATKASEQPRQEILVCWRSSAHRLARKINCRMLAVLVLAIVTFAIGLSFVATAKSVSAATRVSCGAGTFYFGGGCVPCKFNPSQCLPPINVPTTPNIRDQEKQGEASPQEHRVNVNTISRDEAPGYNLGVYDKSQEQNKVCTVDGAPAYALTSRGAAAGTCSRNAEKYFDPSASCPAGTHRRLKGDSGQYWCDSDRTDYAINNQVIGHTVCMLGALQINDKGLCMYCPRVSSQGLALNRDSSIDQQTCLYGTTTPTTEAVTTSAPILTTTTTIAIPATSSPTTSIFTPPAPPTSTPSNPPPPQYEPGGIVIPSVALRWSPQNAITQMPLFVWIEITSGSTQQIWTDDFGRTFSSELAIASMIWNFEVVDGQGRSWIDSITCQGQGRPWMPDWIDAKGNPTATARSEGACWYIYRHMGDGLPRQVDVEITWEARSCQTAPSAGKCETVRHERTQRSSISISEIQAIIT